MSSSYRSNRLGLSQCVAVDWICYWNAGKSTSTSATLQWTSTRAVTGWSNAINDHWNLLKCYTKPCDLEATASDRRVYNVWKIICEIGLMNSVNDWITASQEQRANRHVAASEPNTGPQCRQCSRVCASQFGLLSHLWIHHSNSHDTHRRSRRTSAAAAMFSVGRCFPRCLCDLWVVASLEDPWFSRGPIWNGLCSVFLLFVSLFDNEFKFSSTSSSARCFISHNYDNEYSLTMSRLWCYCSLSGFNYFISGCNMKRCHVCKFVVHVVWLWYEN